ncbi:MAG: ABC transporter permease subunit [Anaerolineae bacterium]|nr:ABC transporter permease subunit [Anaerolineae bacterium]
MKHTGVIFKRILRDSRTAIIAWGIGLAVYAIFTVVIYPFVQDFKEINEMMKLPIMQAMLGDKAADVTSPGGFLGTYFFLMMPLITAVYSVLYGLGITAAEEDRGTLDVLLSYPLPRWQLILEKFAALVAALALMLAITLVGFVAGMIVTPSLEVNFGDLILAALNLLPINLVMAALTLLLSTILRSRGLVGGIVGTFVFGSYFVKTFSALVEDPLTNIRYASIFHYYGGSRMMLDGVDWGGALLLLVVTGALVALSLATFQRRDLGT